MAGYFKSLGVALTTAIALCAVAAPVALAQEEQGLLTSPTPVTLNAAETGEPASNANALTAFGAAIRCPGSTYTGHKYNVTPHDLILSGAVRITLTPHYKQENCTAAAGIFRATVQTNGCDYVLRLGKTEPVENDEDTYAASTDIVCPPGKSIEVRVYTTEPKHDNDEPFCIAHVREQVGLEGAHFTDTGTGLIDIEGTFEGVHAERTTLADPVLCPTQTTSIAKFDIDLTIDARSAGGEPKALSISE